ncbi:MAG TPA: hypothetical protein DCM73_12425 [Clostridiales bacterium]|nr:hypothetical protein [Clostridiales bacterium]
MKTSLSRTVILNSVTINKIFTINCIETILSKLSDENYPIESYNLTLTSSDYGYYDFNSIDELKSKLSNRIDLFKLELILFLESNNNHIRVEFRPYSRIESSPKKYTVDISTSSNDTIYAENLLELILSLFSNGEFIFYDADKLNSDTDEKVIVTFPESLSVTTSTSESERGYLEQKDKDDEKRSFKKEILLLLIGAVIGLIFNFIAKKFLHSNIQ